MTHVVLVIKIMMNGSLKLSCEASEAADYIYAVSTKYSVNPFALESQEQHSLTRAEMLSPAQKFAPAAARRSRKLAPAKLLRGRIVAQN